MAAQAARQGREQGPVAKKKQREKAFRVVRDPDNPGSYLLQTQEGETICPAATRASMGADPHTMRAGRWRLLHMAYVDDETGDERAQGEFWIPEEYAHRVPCW